MWIYAVLLIVLFNMASFRASKVLISLFAIELGASQLLIGFLVALYSLFPMLLALYAGKLSDRLGARLPTIVGSLGLAAGLAVPYFFTSLAGLCASAVLIGVFHMMYNVSVQNLVGSFGGPEDRTRNFSNYALAMACGSFVGPMSAGFAIDLFGHATSYLYFAALPLVPVLIMAGARGVGGGARTVKSEEEQAVLSTNLLANPVLRRTLIASAVATTAQDLFQFYMPIYGH